MGGDMTGTDIKTAPRRGQEGAGHRAARAALTPISAQPIRPYLLPRHMPVAGEFAQVDRLSRS